MSLADDLRTEARCVHPAAADAMLAAADDLDRLAADLARVTDQRDAAVQHVVAALLAARDEMLAARAAERGES